MLGNQNPAHEWLTADEAATYLQVKVRTLLRWVRQGQVQGYALSGTKRRVWRFQRADLDRAVFAHPVIVSAAPTVLPKDRRVI
jgi:excisionase family DNA binding protein